MLVYPLTLKTTGEPWCDPGKGVSREHRKRDYAVVAALLSRMVEANLVRRGDFGNCTYHQSPGGTTHLSVPVCKFGGLPADKVDRLRPAVTFVWGRPSAAGLSAHAGVGYGAAPVCLGSGHGWDNKGPDGFSVSYSDDIPAAARRVVADAATLLAATCPPRLRRWKAATMTRTQAVGFLLGLPGRRAASRLPGERKVGMMVTALALAGGETVTLLQVARAYGRVVQDHTSPLGGLYRLRVLAELAEEDYGPKAGKARVAA